MSTTENIAKTLNKNVEVAFRNGLMTVKIIGENVKDLKLKVNSWLTSLEALTKIQEKLEVKK